MENYHLIIPISLLTTDGTRTLSASNQVLHSVYVQTLCCKIMVVSDVKGTIASFRGFMVVPKKTEKKAL